MNTVRLEAQDMYKLQDYIDAQYGGPGQGLVPDRATTRSRRAR